MPKQFLQSPCFSKAVLPLLFLCGGAAAVYFSGIGEHFSLNDIQARKDEFLAFKEAHFFEAAAIFLALYTAIVALSLPFATVLTLLGGFLFGKIWGTVFVVSAATLGATVIFTVAKSSVGAVLRKRAGGLYKKIEAQMQDGAVSYLLFVRLVPLFPFFLVNIVPALFNIRLRVFVLTTFFGIMPGTFVYVNVGEALGDIERTSDLVSPEILAAFALLGVFALIPHLYRAVFRKDKGNGSK